MNVLSFNDLLKFDGNPPVNALIRDKATATRYGYWKRSFIKKGTSVCEYILKNIFDNFENKRFIITENKFPYVIDDDVAHLVVWANPLYDTNEEEIRQFLTEKLSAKNFVLFMNNVKNMSIHNVTHWQLFIKKEDINKLTIDKFE